MLKLLNITAAQVALRRDGIQLYIKDIATGAEIRVENQFYSDATYGIENIVFSDGTSWNREAIQQAAVLMGDANDNQMYGYDTADTFQGNGGADYLAGGKGSDTYRYASGDGSDQIDEWGTAGDTDVLKLLNITSPQVALRRDGIQLYVKDIATGAEIRVENQFYSDATYGIERIVFSDGTSWNREAIQQAAVLMGDAGANQMYGYDTADTFQGNGGADYLAGGKGSDTYCYSSGDGSDRIDEWGTAVDTDVLKLLDLTPAQVALRRDGNQLYVKDLSTGQEIRVENQFYSDATYGIEQIAFADGTLWDRNTIQSQLPSAMNGANRMLTIGDATYSQAFSDDDLFDVRGEEFQSDANVTSFRRNAMSLPPYSDLANGSVSWLREAFDNDDGKQTTSFNRANDIHVAAAQLSEAVVIFGARNGSMMGETYNNRGIASIADLMALDQRQSIGERYEMT